MGTENDGFPRPWAMLRYEDESGMSGLGRVAEGVELPSGVCVYWWLVPPHSVQVMPSMEAVEHVHSHGGRQDTRIEYVDELTVERGLSR